MNLSCVSSLFVGYILAIMRRAYVTLIVLATVFSMAWYKKVMPKGCVYTEKIQVTRGIFYGIPLESVA